MKQQRRQNPVPRGPKGATPFSQSTPGRAPAQAPRYQAAGPSFPSSDASAYSRSSGRYGSGSAKGGPSGFGGPGGNSNAPGQNPKGWRRLKTWQKTLVVALAVLLVAVVGVGTAAALYVNSLNSAMSFKDEGELTELREELAPVQNAADPFYVMLLGSDARGGEASRSDVNILLRVDPEKAQLTMVSIPRDTKVEIEGYGTQKINAAYAFGGASLAVKTMSQFSGAPISHYAEIHFDELVQLIDAIGGVTVNVEERIDDPDAGDVVIEAGEQTLNGEAALVFARSRAYADGDFTRTSNQRALLTAIIEKVLSLSPVELPGAIQGLASCVTTDYNVGDVVALAQQFQKVGDFTVYSGMVPSTTATIDGVSYVITDEAAWADMMAAIDAGEDPSSLADAG